jgi:hypothetical protein
MQREHQLLEVVLALGSAGCLAGLLDGWEQQCDKDGDDCNHHQQFDQREATPSMVARNREHLFHAYTPVEMNGKQQNKKCGREMPLDY